MTKRVYIIPILAFLAGCTIINSTPESAEPQPVTPVSGTAFHAVVEQVTPAVKTMLNEDLEFLWNEDDEISIFRASTYNREYLFDGMDESESGDFDEINSPESRGVMFSSKPLDKNYAVYPYNTSKHVALSSSAVLTVDLPGEQTYRENSVGPGANLMTAVTADTETHDLVFKNVCGYLKINLYGDDVIVRSVTLTANGGEKLSGRAKIPLVYGEAPAIEMQASKTYSYVTITSEEGVTLGTTKATATAFWFVVPPVAFSSGFTISVQGFYGGDFSRSAPLNLTVARNKYYNIAPLKVTLSGGAMGVGVSGWDSSSSYSGSAS